MRYNMDFLVAALIFLIVLWHHFMKQRQYAGNKTEKTFQIFMMLGIGDILLDMVSTVVIDNSRPEFARMLYVILLLFYLCQLLIPPVLYLYTGTGRMVSGRKIIGDTLSVAFANCGAYGAGHG